MAADSRFLVVVFDALRPEFVTPELMPNLSAFAKAGVSYPNSRSVFLTETRVNQTAVVTGCLPRRNGIVANHMMALDVWQDRSLNTGIEAELARAFAEARGNLIQVPTLGQRLAAAGRTYASLSAGTPGGGRLINHSAEADGTFRFAMRAPEAAVPAGVLDQIASVIGPMPEYERPATAWITWAVDAYLEWVDVHAAPDVMLLWLCEPDETFHYHGIGSDAALTTIRHADAEFGRILAGHRAAMEAGQMQIIAMSDHGQITLEGERLDIAARLREAGIRAARQPGPDVDCVAIVHNGGGIWVRDDDPQLTEVVVATLLEQDWCGPLFTRDGTLGTLRLGDVCLEHARAPTIALTMRTSEGENAFGRAGLTRHDAPYPDGGGCHGGLSRFELDNFLSMAGSVFKSGVVIEAPAGNIDVAPTIAAVLGMDIAEEIDGRVLEEALRGGSEPAETAVTETVLTSRNARGPLTHLSYSEYAGTRYLNRAWVA